MTDREIGYLRGFSLQSSKHKRYYDLVDGQLSVAQCRYMCENSNHCQYDDEGTLIKIVMHSY